MRCPQCNQSVRDEAEYCEHCGHKLSSGPSKEERAGSSSPKETPRKVSETKDAPETKKAAGPSGAKSHEKPATGRKEEGEHREDEKEKEFVEEPRNPFPWKGTLIFMGLIAVVFVLYSQMGKDRPPPLPKQDILVGSDSFFFQTLWENVHRTGDAKSYYMKAERFMGAEGSPLTLPSTAPSTLPTEAEKPSFLKAAENYALAQENFEMVNNSLKEVKVKSVEVDQEKCKNDFLQATANFISASQILNDHAKALYLGDPKRASQNFITDAKAKYKVADQAMTELLLGGCNGAFFKYIQSRPASEKEQAMTAYKNFFQDQFDLHRSALELLMGYQPAPPTP